MRSFIASLRLIRNLTPVHPVSNVCEAVPISLFQASNRLNEITGNAFRISLHPVWQIDNSFFLNKSVMVRNQILVHRWRPRARILALFRRRTWPEFSFVCGTGQCFIATFKFFFKLLSTLIYHSVEHDNFGFSAGWFLDKVSETDYTTVSPSFSLLMYRLN